MFYENKIKVIDRVVDRGISTVSGVSRHILSGFHASIGASKV